MAKEHTQYSGFLNSSGVPLTSSNQDGGKERKKHTSMAKKKDPVLNNTLYGFRKKQDIIDEIRVSASTLGLSLARIPLLSFIGQQWRIKSKLARKLWLTWSLSSPPPVCTC
jgi:hypothetical protein